jgi:signal transduction histidine kinase/HAMP domain-containing protein
MRGGLGRILLTAFMLLAIVPLSVVSYLAVGRVQRDMRQAAIDNLIRVATSSAVQLQTWLDAQRYGLALLAGDTALVDAIQAGRWEDACTILQACSPDCVALALSPDPDGKENLLCAAASAAETDVLPALVLGAPVEDGSGETIATLVGYPDLGRLIRLTEDQQGIRVFLVDASDRRVQLSLAAEISAHETGHPWAADVSAGNGRGGGLYQTVSGEPVVGAYQWLPGWGVTLWAEQPQEEMLAREDDLAAMLIGSTLAVALLTAVLAAVITRQLTRPIVRLTMSAVKIAGGDLEQTVELNRRDEIGILARAFNIMTAELRSLYASLEQKVDERTQQLTEVNRELRYKAMQLRLSAEVGRVATSILDPDLLLRRVTELVLETYAHVYDVYYVAILLQDEFGERLERQACSGRGGECEVLQAAVGDLSLIGQTASDGALRSQDMANGSVQMVIPLRIGPRVIGSLDLHCARRDILGSDVVEVLQSLGDQISVAIENARLYAIEREAVQRLSRLDDLRLASLGVGSRELATELNTIIGFSRLILKEADGPLSEMQRADLIAIYKSGYKLLGLIDNVITLSELESGTAEVGRQPVDLSSLLSQVLTTAQQRLADVTIEWQEEKALLFLQGDAPLLRQAFLGLVTAAAELIPQDRIAVTVLEQEPGPSQATLYIGSRDPESMRSGEAPSDAEIEEMGVGLALAREVVRLHQGELDLRFDMESGLNSVVRLPLLEQN